MRKYLIINVLLVVLSVFSFFQAEGISVAPTVSDTILERLMNKSAYREASTRILSKLKSNSGISQNLKHYLYNKLSFVQLRLRNIDSALIIARISLELSKKSEDSILISDSWRVAAYAYNNAGKLDSALYFTKLMMSWAERNHQDRQLRNAIVSMATLLAQNRQFQEALNYYHKAYRLTHEIRDSANFASSVYNLGLTHLNLNNTDSCLHYLKRAEEIAVKEKKYDILVYIYGTIADCYLRLKEEKLRKRYLLLANEIAEKIGNNQFLAMGYSNLTQGAIESREFHEAIEYGLKTLALLKIQPYPILKEEVDSMLAIAYRESGNFQEAYRSLESFMKEKEMILGEVQQEKLNKLVVELKVKEKDLTITTQKLEITEKKRRISMMILLLIIVGLLLFGQLLYTWRTRIFQKQLFRKEKELDKHALDIREWMEWRQNQQPVEEEVVESQTEFPDVASEESTLSFQSTLFAELRELFDRQKLFLDPELNLNTVIRMLGTNKRYLYQAINENTDDNFRSFLNRYRVDEAKTLIEDLIRKNENQNLSEIYNMAGFNSAVSFFRAFKLVTGLTPKEYAAEIKSELKKQL